MKETTALINAKAKVFLEGQRVIEVIKQMEKTREESLQVRTNGR